MKIDPSFDAAVQDAINEYDRLCLEFSGRLPQPEDENRRREAEAKIHAAQAARSEAVSLKVVEVNTAIADYIAAHR